MPRLSPDEVPAIKVDPAGLSIEMTLTDEQRRGLFERPGAEVVGIVRFAAKSYTGYDQGEDKDPVVKVRVVGAEMARDNEQQNALLEAARAMYRRREIDGTLDAVGQGPQDPGDILDAEFAAYPTEGDLRAHRADRQRAER